MKVIIAAFLVFIFRQADAQEWHSSNERLSEPSSPSGVYASVNYFSRYDTVPCTYESLKGKGLCKGYKVVYVKDDYYTDNSRTFGVFLDDRLQRISNVRRYYFN